MTTIKTACAALALALMACAAHADPAEDIRAVAALDTAYQAAVERNDADAMAAILHEGMILVLGDGSVHTRDDLLNSARTRRFIYQHQIEDEGTQTVRLYGENTAIVTARLHIKATRANEPIEFRLWFSDTYVRTPTGWRYAFGQASAALSEQDEVN
jgi:ketosteroid isomerase-like protein